MKFNAGIEHLLLLSREICRDVVMSVPRPTAQNIGLEILGSAMPCTPSLHSCSNAQSIDRDVRRCVLVDEAVAGMFLQEFTIGGHDLGCALSLMIDNFHHIFDVLHFARVYVNVRSVPSRAV